jgi:hypothetical protein
VDGLDGELLAELGRPAGVEIAVVPLVVRTRVVGLLVGDCDDVGIDRDALEQVRKLGIKVSAGFERMLVRRKREGMGASHPEGTPVQADGPPARPEGAPTRPEAAPRRHEGAPLSGRPPPPFRPSQSAFGTISAGPPPPRANIASVRPIAGPPIAREDPVTPPAPRPNGEEAGHTVVQAVARAHSQANMHAHAPARGPSVEGVPGAGRTSDPPARRSAPPRSISPSKPRAPVRSVPPPPRSLPPPKRSTIPPDYDLGPIIDRLLAGEATEADEANLVRQGDVAMHQVMAHFPGPVTFPRARAATLPNPPRPSECGPLLRFVARSRKAALGFVIQRLEDPDPEVRGWSTYLASELPYAELIPRLIPRLHDSDPVTRASAAHAMGAISRIFRDEVRATVLALLRATDPRQRASAMPVVAVLRDATIVPELVRSLGDPDPDVVAATHAALVHVTRQDFGPGAWPWVRWWEENRSRHRVEWLIDALTSERLDLRRAAGEELRTLTREYFGYASDLPVHDRQRVQQRYRDWWAVEGRTRFART